MLAEGNLYVKPDTGIVYLLTAILVICIHNLQSGCVLASWLTHMFVCL